MAASSDVHSAEQNPRPRIVLDFEELRARLRSGYGPAAQSQAEIERELLDVAKDFEDYETEASRLQSRIIHVQNELQRLAEYRTYLRSLVSPIRKLPNEVLACIFDHSCNMNELMSRDLKKMPTLGLSGVCARWRALSLSCSSLWSRMQIELRETAHTPGQLLIVDLFIERSRQSLLMIDITGDRELSDVPEHHDALLASLSRLSHRFQWVRVLPVIAWNGMMMRGSPQFPELESFDGARLAFSPTAANCLQNSPKLRNLALGGHPSEMHLQKLPWKQLTSLSLYNFSDEMSDLAEACSNLRELNFEEMNHRHYSRWVPARTTAKLQSLSLSLTPTTTPEPGLAEVAFASITSPSLASLRIQGPEDPNPPYIRTWPKESLHAFISRSSRRLTTLSIKHIPLFDYDLTALLHLLPSLLDLTVDDSNVAVDKSPITRQFVQDLHAFRRHLISSALVPKLRSLSLTFNGQVFSDEDFVDVVTSRWSQESRGEVACLQSVVMRFRNRQVREATYRPLKYLEMAGMRVVVIGQGL